jgi:hypothetical protein
LNKQSIQVNIIHDIMFCAMDYVFSRKMIQNLQMRPQVSK